MYSRVWQVVERLFGKSRQRENPHCRYVSQSLTCSRLEPALSPATLEAVRGATGLSRKPLSVKRKMCASGRRGGERDCGDQA
jgi:hypothetical protein